MVSCRWEVARESARCGGLEAKVLFQLFSIVVLRFGDTNSRGTMRSRHVLFGKCQLQAVRCSTAMCLLSECTHRAVWHCVWDRTAHRVRRATLVLAGQSVHIRVAGENHSLSRLVVECAHCMRRAAQLPPVRSERHDAGRVVCALGVHCTLLRTLHLRVLRMCDAKTAHWTLCTAKQRRCARVQSKLNKIDFSLGICLGAHNNIVFLIN